MKKSDRSGKSKRAQFADRSPVVSRRAAMQYGALVGAAASSPWLLSACSDAGGSGSSGADSIAVAADAGLLEDCLREAWADPFTTETGIKVLTSATDAENQIRVAVETGVYDIDVVSPTADLVASFGPKLLEPIDYTVINRDEIVEGLAQDYGVAFDTYSVNLVYNKKFTGGATPTRLEDFFDLEKFPGKRGFSKYLPPARLAAVALMADGVAPEDVFPFDWDRAYQKLNTIKDQLVFFDGGAQSVDWLNSGETPLIYTFPNRVVESLKSGQPVGLIWDGHTVQGDMWAIAKGNPNKDAAMRFIASTVRKDLNGKYVECIGGGASPSNTLVKLPKELEKWAATTHSDQRHFVMDASEVVSWIAENQDEIDQRYQEWLAE